MSNIIKAIQKINPTAQVSVSGEDIDSIVWENGTAEISKTDIQEQLLIVEQEIEDEAQAKIDNKASANTKLKALGLTDAEIEALKN